MATVGREHINETAHRSKGEIAALVSTIVMLAALAAVPIIGAYGFAREYEASVPVSVVAGLVVACAIGLAWLLGRPVARAD